VAQASRPSPDIVAAGALAGTGKFYPAGRRRL
jgi:hypothetical protein